MKKDYHIQLVGRNGNPIKSDFCPYFYGITDEMMKGICIGIMIGSGRKTASVQVHEIEDGKKQLGKLVWKH